MTPLRPWQLILGKLTPFAIIGMLDTVVIVILAQVVFGVPLRGRYYGIILRGVFLKGSGLDVLWPEALILAATGFAWLAFASLRFRKRLD